MTRVSHSTHIAVTAGELFDFHLDAANLARISPPLPPVTVEGAPAPTRAGDEQVIHLSLGLTRIRWVVTIRHVRPPAAESPGFLEDVQSQGPFRHWRHQHQVFPTPDGATLKDIIEFSFFPSPAGGFLDRLLVAPGIKMMLAWRHRRTRDLLAGA